MSEHWQRVKKIYDGALALDPVSRDVYVRHACDGDKALEGEVLDLLRYDAQAEAHGFLEAPVGLGAQSQGAPASSGLMAGQRIGPYEINSLIGEGGMGRVYDATDTRLGRRVALKLLRTEIADSPGAQNRFIREARSAAALNHANIATIYDAGEHHGQLFLTMEFVEGESLRLLLESSGGRGLPEADAIRYAEQLASALDHAHGRGILHRDLKPENIMIRSAGALKLVDFGIAKAPASDEETRGTITNPGVFVGTLRYAPPEVIVGATSTRESDLYSFGVVLFEMLRGQTPFEGLSAIAMVEAILKGEVVSIHKIDAAVSEGLGRIVDRCMARDPANRFQSAADLLAALERLNGASGTSAAPEMLSTRDPALAILEFANLSQDESLDWLCTGMVETLAADLNKVGVPVVSRARTQQALRGATTDISETRGLVALGNRLGAKWIATGSFQRVGNRIRVTPKVFKVAVGEAVYTEKIDGLWEDLFEVQDRVVSVLMQALDVGVAPMQPQARKAEAHPLDAYEHYSNGRRCLSQLGRDSLAQAKQYFQKAVACDARHALAFSGLGSAYAMSYIHTSSPEDLRLARQYLDRAIELDGELGEPYPFLCYIYYRLGEPKRALEMGEKGVKLQSDLAQAHYFYGAVQFMALELGLGNCQRAIDSMTVAIRLDPRAGSQWMIAGSVALCRSLYSTAQRLFERALRLETNPNVPRRFVGASCMLGFVYSRQLAWEDARRCHLNSIESMRGIEHVYRDVVISLSACGLGEIELRIGHPEESLARFRHAWRLVKEEARMIGNRRIGIRAQVGMAAAYARFGDREKAGQHLAEALSRLPSVEPGSWVFDTSFGELHYAIACAQLGLNLFEEAVASLSSAVDTGFSDAAWLQADPEWKPLHTKHQYRELVERMRLIPPVTIDIDSFPADTPISSSAIQA